MRENPFREGMPAERHAESCTMVIFGATGDLTRRKLVPALYNIARDRLLPPGFSVVGFARRDWNDEKFRAELKEGVNEFSRSRPVEERIWDDFARGLFYCRGSFDDPEAYTRLARMLATVTEKRGTRGNRLFYLATPPRYYPSIIRALGQAGLSGSAGTPWSRIIIEKPFGRDLASARDLNLQALNVFSEDQIYRIDHYLGKETVQNILVMRFGNGIFEPLWNYQQVEHIQVTVAENLGMEGRGAYYDSAGTLRDMVQNHMLQLLCLTAMEPPVAFEADAVRNEKVKVLQAIRPIPLEDLENHVVRGQYAAGFINGVQVPAFRSEKGVAADSRTETYVALRLFIDNWRWAGVPFYLRSGKRLPKRATEISIHFKKVPHLLFAGRGGDAIEPNVLSLRIQPDEGISLRITSKVPGSQVMLRPVVMDFRYGTSFGVDPPEAYERLLLDAIAGDSTLFTRRDEVEAAWRFMTPILERWQAEDAPPVHLYEAGSWGPTAASALIDRWRRL
ncbi:MAG: glucose-6-phosphate dehydrogenase [Acidobacteriota bacterium]